GTVDGPRSLQTADASCKFNRSGNKKPRRVARALVRRAEEAQAVRSGNLAERLLDAGLESLGGAGRGLLGGLRQALRLRGQGLELLARMGGRELGDLGDRLCADQLARMVEGRIGIGAGELE